MFGATVEFSGFGHYGICTVLKRVDIPHLSETLSQMRGAEEWSNPEFEPYKSIGLDGALAGLNWGDDGSPELRFTWNPCRMAESMNSHHILTRAAATTSSEVEEDLDSMELEVHPYAASRGWGVQANFSSAVWDVIESPDFKTAIPHINSDIQKWWQDQSGRQEESQYTTVFKGRDGPTLQVYQPAGNGLWIVGCRKAEYVNQITDHNTDTAFLAFGHVVSLCTILKHCRSSPGL